MKLSYNWLRQLVDLSSVDPKILGDALTLHSCELEELVYQDQLFSRIVTGKVLSIESHKNSDKLMKAMIDLGKEKKQILFGKALGVSIGDIVPVALPGAMLPNGMEIVERDMAGEASQGMICINSELGYKNENLTVFPSQTPLGISLATVDPEFGDVMLDIDNKSITHRPDMWGHRGFARELSAIFGAKKQFLTPKTPQVATKEMYPVRIETDHCRRFCAIRLSGVTVRPSETAIQTRLENLGIRAISNMVDITNLILLEYGQPMHIFDADKVKGSIIIRHARKGESLVALDGETYELQESDIVIADEEKVLSIAGIMGGLASGVTSSTQNILFESANFDAATIRRTSVRLGLRSDSSMRFEKTLDPENCELALWGAVDQALKSCPNAQITTALQSVYPHPYKKLVIALHPEKVRNIAGIDITDAEIIRILESIEFKVISQKYCLEVEVPTFRATKDIEMEEDLIEEIVRLYGFNNIPSQIPHLPLTPPRKNPLRSLEWQVRDFLAHRGIFEVMNYSLVSETDPAFTEESDYVCIQNPLSCEQALLRKTLASHMIGGLETDLRTHKKIKIFELGKTYHPDHTNPLPIQQLHLGVLFGEISKRDNELFYALKDDLVRLGKSLQVDFSFVPSQTPNPLCHPSKQADIMVGLQKIGSIAIVHPEKNTIKQSSLVFAEINLEALLSFVRWGTQATKISPFPKFHRDISLLLPKKVLMSEVEQMMYKATSHLKSAELFDEFFDDARFGVDRKNLAFHLSFQSLEKTLSDEEVEADFQNIVSLSQKSFGGELRL